MSAAPANPDSERWPRRLIYVCGAVAASLVFAVSLVGVVVEAQLMWREGAAAFFSDAGLRLGAGVCIAVLTCAPYLLVAKASRVAGPPIVFAIAGLSMFVFQLWFTGYTLLFARSSTAALSFFMPLYLCVPAIGIWAAAFIARRVKVSRG